MAYKTRATLINKNGKDLVNRLREEFPEIEWYLTLKDGREVCVGIKSGKPVVIGSEYDIIIANLTL